MCYIEIVFLIDIPQETGLINFSKCFQNLGLLNIKQSSYSDSSSSCAFLTKNKHILVNCYRWVKTANKQTKKAGITHIAWIIKCLNNSLVIKSYTCIAVKKLSVFRNCWLPIQWKFCNILFKDAKDFPLNSLGKYLIKWWIYKKYFVYGTKVTQLVCFA